MKFLPFLTTCSAIAANALRARGGASRARGVPKRLDCKRRASSFCMLCGCCVDAAWMLFLDALWTLCGCCVDAKIRAEKAVDAMWMKCGRSVDAKNSP